ncbi:MAG: ATP-binding cassette domain-containing protein [Candidatus Sumerlaeota bacterium]|nr:ATP-binding cassette domain-containing protein [Candidatus Sumerlaeota bacterium]
MDLSPLEIHELRHVYGDGVVALDALSLRIGRGVFGLLGPNGAGKTTLMEILALRRRPTAGRVMLGAVDLLRSPDVIRRRLGYLPQVFAWFPNMTVRQSLVVMARLFGLRDREARRRGDEALERARLTRLGRRRFRALSGGEKRRFGIAQAILNNPGLLIVDEPTTGLDAEERLAFHTLLFELGQERIVLLSTHIVRDIEATCARLAVLHHGRLIFHDRVEALVRLAEGRTWEFPTDGETVDRLAETGRLVSVREETRGFIARVVEEEKPSPAARSVEPGLEDAYIRLVGREGLGD